MLNPNAFQPGTAAKLSVEVELTISARKLRDMDIASKSDPMCIIYTQPFGQSWVEHSRTEVLQNCLNPDFATKIKLDYHFEEQQKLKFKIYDVDSGKPSIDDDDFLGEVDSTLAQIVSSQTLRVDLSLKNKPAGELIVSAEEISECKQELELLFGASNLKKSGILSKPDPFLSIFREVSGARNLIYRTVRIDDTLNPTWPRFSLPMRLLRDASGQDFSLVLQCFNHNSDGNHKLMGEVQIQAKELMDGPKIFRLKDMKKSATKDIGELKLKDAHIRQTYTFLDYIMGGTQINCTFAIDFTASNGHPSNPSSLHFAGPTPNCYESAIRAVGDVIQEYDTDKQFPVLGFGARILPSQNVLHEFFINMTSDNPYCHRVEGILQAYRACLNQVELYGPTCFAPVINHAANYASQFQNGDHYFILTILTDGEICDMANTKRAIVRASALPLSIIIVGVGNADFSSMNKLDSDDKILSADGMFAVRDIVQFVPFNSFLHQHRNDPVSAGFHLARSLLAEIPDQLVSFMKSKQILPKTAVRQLS